MPAVYLTESAREAAKYAKKQQDFEELVVCRLHRHNMTRKGLADMLSMSTNTLRLKLGTCEFTVPQLRTMQKALKIAPEEMMSMIF